MRIVIRLLVVSLLASAAPLQAITYVVPSDRDLVKRAEAIVIATAVESHAELRDDGRIVTVTTLQVEKLLKGSVGGDMQLVELGGTVGERATIIPGSPRFDSGKRYLIFLRTNKSGERTTYGFGLGKFEFTSDLHGVELLTRGSSDDEMFGFDEAGWVPHVEPLRSAGEFLNFVRNVVKGEGPGREDYVVDRSSVVFATFPEFTPRSTKFVPVPLVVSSLADSCGATTRPDYLTSGNFRWQSPTAGFVYCCTPTLQPNFPNAVSDTSSAMANWNTQGVGVNYTLGSADNTANKGFTAVDCKNTVLFNDPNHEITGAAAIGGISTTGTTCVPPPGSPGGPFTYANLGDDITYNKTLEVDVVVGANGTFSTNEATFIGVLTHELGHTLGFRHSDQTGANNPSIPCSPPSGICTSSAIMNSTIAFNMQSLQPYDVCAVTSVYGNGLAGPACNAPSIATHPASQSITFGSQAVLSVTAGGTAPLTYQWYTGASPSTANPVAGATNATFNPSPTTTTSYWVRVQNSCSGVQTANSNTAVVTVTCTAPSAPAPNAAPSTITSSQSSILTVSPTGTSPFTYQWYVGNSGVTTSPIPSATGSSVTVSPTITTSYWVRVSGPCGQTSDSPSVTVTVAPCVPPTASTPNAAPSSIPVGQSTTLFENPSGSGPFTYQWFIGPSGNTSNPIAGSSSSNTVSPATTTTYWVRVTGQCAPASDSQTVTVTVTCSPISSAGVDASPRTINPGQSSTLFFTPAGNGPFTIQWYTGNQGDTSNPIPGATGTSVSVSPTVTTAYWVRVSSPACGSQDGSVALIVNGTPCIAPSITTQPASSTIGLGTPVTLTVGAGGTAPFTYQWYTGEKGDTTHPISNANQPSVTQSPAATTKYWVRVSNSCNGTQSADSNAATVTVSTCTPPSITTQPLNVAVAIGTAATLKVVAAGTAPLHYQWFRGVKGDTTKPVGTDSATFVSGAIDGNTSFWVHVTGQCGNAIDSNAGNVTVVAPPRGRASRH